jgi:glycerol-3-phosphate acyltransferase PlsX
MPYECNESAQTPNTKLQTTKTKPTKTVSRNTKKNHIFIIMRCDMKIAIDAMGGDFAPLEIVKGAVSAARENQIGLILAGPREAITAELTKYETSGLDIEILHTDEYLVEGESPAYALRTKRHASISLAVKQVKEGRAAAAVGMGPTGGIMAAALMHLGTLEGISRPVVGGQFLGLTPQTVTFDMGGNLDCRPDQLLDFAIVGTVYARYLLQIPHPKIALLNVGWEEGKGNSQVKEAYNLLKNSGLNFIGNIEGNEIASGKANVIICDGFVGNVAVKFCEGLGTALGNWLEEELASDLTVERIQDIRQKLLQITVKADSSGGGPLWAVNGLVLKGHGRSRSFEVATTLKNAKLFSEMDIVGALKSELAAVRSRLKPVN